MTVTNPLLRFLARWVMRIEATRGILQLGLFGGTFMTTGLTALHQYGYSEYARPFIVMIGVTILLVAYGYTESGIWNQKNRETKDKSTNYVAPGLYMRSKMFQVMFEAYLKAQREDMDIEELEAEMDTRILDQWAKMRDGIDIDRLDEYAKQQTLGGNA